MTELGIETWGSFLLEYVASDPAVKSAAPGSATIPYLEDKMGTSRGQLAGAASRTMIEQF